MPASSPSLSLQLLGPPQLRLHGEPARLTRKALAVLVTTALSPQGLRRETLAERLWPGLDHAAARRNLRRELHRLREAGAGAALEGDGELLRLASEVSCDWQGPDAPLPVAAHDAPPLQDFHFPDEPELDAWLGQRRDEIDAHWRRAIERAVAHAEATARLSDAVRLQAVLARRFVLDEAVARELMRLQAAAEGPQAALHTFETLQRALREELGADVQPQTRSLAEQLARREPAPSHASRAAAEPVLASAMPLVGRDAALAELEQGWAAAQLLLVAGEAGLGKTRLAQTLAARHGAHAIVSCRALDRQRPYAAAAQALRALREAAPEVALPEWAARELARIVPELGPPAPMLDSADDQRRFEHAFALAWQAWTAENFACVIIDDWHLADAATAALLPTLPGTPQGARTLLAYRPGELGEDEAAPLEAACARGTARRVTLSPLGEGDLGTLLTLLNGGTAAPLFARRLHQACGGHPRFLLEMLRHLFDTGLLQVEPGGHWASPFDDVTEDYRELPLPPSIRETVLARWQAQDETVRSTLDAAALAGERFDAALLRSVVPLGEAAAAAALQRAVLAGFLIAEGTQHWRFEHDLVRQSIAEAVPRARRLSLHSALAGRMAAAGHPAAEVAWHHEQAGEAMAAARCLLQAADEASGLRSSAQALALTDQALALLARGPADTGLRALVHAKRGALLRQQGDGPRALAETALACRLAIGADAAVRTEVELRRASVCIDCGSPQEALDRLAALDDTALDADRRAWSLRLQSQAWRALGNAARAEAAARAALAADPDARPERRALLLDTLALLAMQRGDFEQMDRLAAEVHALAVLAGHQHLIMRSMGRRGVAAMLTGRRDEALARFEALRAHARDVGDVEVQREALLNLVKLHADVGDADTALALTDEGYMLSPRFESPVTEHAFLQCYYYCHTLRGDLGQALQFAQRLIADAEHLPEMYWRVGAALVVADLFLHLGDLARVAPLLEQAEALCRDHELQHQSPEVQIKRAWLEVMQDRPQDALARLASLDQGPAVQQVEDKASLARLRALALAATGNAAAAYGLLAPFDQAPTAETWALMLAQRLRCGTQAGVAAPEAVRADIARSRADLASAQMPALEALTLRDAVAAALAALGDAAGAAAERAAATALLARLSASLHAWPEQAQRLRHRFAARS
jgi:DNA-binding SARP family transcriptional activator